jgi:ribosome-binding factor A
MPLINTHKTEIRHELAQKVGKQLRIVPSLEFFLDDSLDYIENIDKLLK